MKQHSHKSNNNNKQQQLEQATKQETLVAEEYKWNKIHIGVGDLEAMAVFR